MLDSFKKKSNLVAGQMNRDYGNESEMLRPQFLQKPVVSRIQSRSVMPGLTKVLSEPRESTLSVSLLQNRMNLSQKIPQRLSLAQGSGSFRPPSFLQVPSVSKKVSTRTINENHVNKKQGEGLLIRPKSNITSSRLIKARDATQLLDPEGDIQSLITGGNSIATSNPFVIKPEATNRPQIIKKPRLSVPLPAPVQSGVAKQTFEIRKSIRDDPTPPLSVNLPESQKIFFAGFQKMPKVQKNIVDLATVASSGDVGSLFDKMAKNKVVFDELNNIQKLNFKLKEALNTYQHKKQYSFYFRLNFIVEYINL